MTRNLNHRHLILSLAAAVGLAVAAPAGAADMNDNWGGYKDERVYGEGSPYDDPRYRDLYADPPPRYAPPPPRYHGEPPRYGWVPPYGANGYLAPLPPPHAFEPRRYGRDDDGCTPRREVRDNLREDGWRDFHDVEVRGPVVRLRARRPSGELYDLKIDRCSGAIVRARAVEDYPDAYAGRHRYGPRGYY